MIRQAVLLVGGRGTRLWPLTANTPKGLMPVAGVPFIEYQLGQLYDVGVEQVILATGLDQRDMWEDFVARRDRKPDVVLSFEDEPLDTAGPVMQVLDRLDERFLVLNGDVIFDTPLKRFIETAPTAGAVLALSPVDDPSSYGVVVTDSDGLVTRFVEKPAPGTSPANTVNAGIYLIERRALEQFESGPLSFERRVFPDLAAAKELGGISVPGHWLDIGTPDLYLDTHERVLTGRTDIATGGLAHAAAADADVRGERTGSWSWAGSRSVIEPGAEVRDAVILDGAIIRSGARVERAVVGWRSEVMGGAVVSGDAIVGADCVIGAECEIGARLRVAPGTRLGKRAISVSPPR